MYVGPCWTNSVLCLENSGFYCFHFSQLFTPSWFYGYQVAFLIIISTSPSLHFKNNYVHYDIVELYIDIVELSKNLNIRRYIYPFLHYCRYIYSYGYLFLYQHYSISLSIYFCSSKFYARSGWDPYAHITLDTPGGVVF